jgi:DNA polymerase III alpha subunit
MKDEGEESSIILWKLKNDRKGELQEWCYIDDGGKLNGPLAKEFQLAIELEGTLTASSRHPAGVVISPVPLREIAPMYYDAKNKQTIVGLDMSDIEKVGLIKYDILSLSLLDKLAYTSQILAGKQDE